jgi:hypothetical protein
LDIFPCRVERRGGEGGSASVGVEVRTASNGLQFACWGAFMKDADRAAFGWGVGCHGQRTGSLLELVIEIIGFKGLDALLGSGF